MHETRSRSLNRPEIKRKREDSEGNVRSSSKVPRDQSGVRDVTMAKKARKISKINQRKINMGGKKGEADRSIAVKKPKHLCKSKNNSSRSQSIYFHFVYFSFRPTINRQNRSSLNFVVFLCFPIELIKDERSMNSTRNRISSSSSSSRSIVISRLEIQWLNKNRSQIFFERNEKFPMLTKVKTFEK